MNEIILLQSDSFTETNNKRKNSFAPDVWLRSSVGRPSRYLNWARMGLGSNGTGFEFCRSLSLFFPDCFSAISYITPYLRSYHYLFTIRRSKITCFIKLRSTNHFTGIKKPLKFASIPTFGFVALLLLALLSRFFFRFFFFFSNFFNCFSLATGWYWMILFHLHRYLQTLLYLFLPNDSNDLISSGGFRWLTGISSAIVKEQIRYTVGFLIKKFVSFNKVHCCLIIIR